MNLYKLKEEIENLRDEKSKLEGSLQQIKKTLKEKGYKSVEEAEEALKIWKKMFSDLQEKYEEVSKDIKSFLDKVEE